LLAYLERFLSVDRVGHVMHLDFNRERLHDSAEDCCNKRNKKRRREMILVTSELVVQMLVND
jgi:hypothetical protein